ncbi:MAG: enoyl-CoA hydratase [Candidatus Rokuibacteriota bacterium]|nr:MAG: enoyl-CoA hydratase [Candidatus Rokubacteria bacterium]
MCPTVPEPMPAEYSGLRRPRRRERDPPSGGAAGTTKWYCCSLGVRDANPRRGGRMTDILVQHDGPIATVVINRPAMRNAISLAMWTELARVTEELGKTDSVRAIVYRGAGTVAFASGADISEFKEQRKDAASAARYNAQTAAAYSTIRECPKPTVAMIFGFCMGGAMAVAMACDMRFAADGSKFGIPAARLSIIYGADSVGQLVDLVGPAYAKDILYSARTVDDREALAMGFIQRLLPVAELEAYTYDYLRKVADNAPLSVRGAKATIESYLLGLTEERRKRLRDLAVEATESEDYKEGTRAFLEKRAAKFLGR